jgi:hypothetical protein
LIIIQLVGRLSQDELIDQLPTFLPALFDAFNNQSPDVRKVGVIEALDISCFSIAFYTGPFDGLVLFHHSDTYLIIFITDCRILFGGYLHHAGESICSILGGS